MATTAIVANGKRRAYIRLLANLFGLVLLIVFARLAASRLLALNMPDLISLWGVTTAGLLGLVAGILPKRLRLEILSRFQRILESAPATIGIWLTVAAVIGLCGISRYEVTWAGPESIEISVNGKPTTLHSAASRNGFRTDHGFALAFRTLTISRRGYRKQTVPRPLQVLPVPIPLFATEEPGGTSSEIQRVLLSAFFQIFEQQQLDDASRLISTMQPESEAEKASLKRLEALHSTLVEIFVKSSGDVASVRTASFANMYPEDPWIPLLSAGASYAGRHFDKCADSITDRQISEARAAGLDEIAAASQFFRGVCHLRMGAKALPINKPRLLGRADKDFAIAETRARRLLASRFKDIALPSSIVFQGISQFYEGLFEKSVATFLRGADSGLSLLRARALNGAGYSKFVQGEIPAAANYINQALSVHPKFSYARSNYGFVLMTDEERYDEAKNYFVANIQDPDLQKTSRRDVILAKLSLVHLLDIRKASLPEVVAGYAGVSRDIGGNAWDGMLQDELRYAYLARELTDRIYLGGEYYAVEIFALTFLCRAKDRLTPLTDRLNPDAVSIRAELDTRIGALRRQVHPAWLQQPGGGWFSALAAC